MMKFFGGMIFSSSILFLQIFAAKYHISRVTTRSYKPLIYHDESGQSFKGIEYKLIKIIAEQFAKEHLDTSIQMEDQLHLLK